MKIIFFAILIACPCFVASAGEDAPSAVEERTISILIGDEGDVEIVKGTTRLLRLFSIDGLAQVKYLDGFTGAGIQGGVAIIVYDKGTKYSKPPAEWPPRLDDILEFCWRHGVPVVSATKASGGLGFHNLLTPEKMELSRQRGLRPVKEHEAELESRKHE